MGKRDFEEQNEYMNSRVNAGSSLMIHGCGQQQKCENGIKKFNGIAFQILLPEPIVIAEVMDNATKFIWNLGKYASVR